MIEIEKLRLENEEKDNIINEKNKEINQIKVFDNLHFLYHFMMVFGIKEQTLFFFFSFKYD